ncbi:proton-conducting transporter transmembrane domain-containing protein [Thermococcus sp.]
MNPYYVITAAFVLSSLAALLSRKLSYGLAAGSAAALLVVIFAYPSYVDELTRYFLMVSGIVWLTAALFSMDYDDHYPRLLACSFSMTIAGMMTILLAGDAVSFLAGWEVMTIASYFGITAKEKDGRGAYRFLAFGELSALLIMAGFGILMLQNGSPSFSTWKVTPLWSTAFFLAALGFAVKMAIFPLHTWLPDAHGSAPANLSAQLSAVLTLMGLYGMLRLLLTGRPADWVGVFFLLFGGLTAVLGASYAAGTEHVKRLPGYSTVENDGILLALFGGAVLAANHGVPALASFAFLALFIYAFAHSVAKGLLFLLAGKIERGDGGFSRVQRESLGMLGVFAGYVSALSLAGVPPFPGFLGEWMGIETLLQSFKLPDVHLKILIALVGALAALTAGIAGVAMSKMITHGFQRAGGGRGRPWENAAYMLSSAVLLAAGVFPVLLFRPVNRLTGSLGGLNAESFTSGALGIKNGFLIVSKDFGGISPTYLTGIILLFGLTVYVLARVTVLGQVKHVRAWSGGLNNPEYPPVAHSAILLITEGWLYGTEEKGGMLRWKERTARAYEKLSGMYLTLSERFRHALMRGSDSIYVAYILLALMAALVYIMLAA